MLHIEGVGNLGAKPKKEMVKVDGEEKPLVTLRVHFDRRRPDGNGGYRDLEGMWRDVTVWKDGLGGRIMATLDKGARVFVRGSEHANSYTNKQGHHVESHTIVADYVAPDLVGIESITFKERAKPDTPKADAEVDDDADNREAAD